jgi:hypothetical protein
MREVMLQVLGMLHRLLPVVFEDLRQKYPADAA